MRKPAFVAGLAALGLLAGCDDEPPLAPGEVGPDPGTFALSTAPTGATPGLSATIDLPADGALVASSAARPLPFSGGASTDRGRTTLLYVMDLGLDSDLVIEPAAEALAALNQMVIDDGVVTEVAVLGYAMESFWADVTPAEERGMFTGPATDANGSGTPDVVEVLESVFVEYAPGWGGSCPPAPPDEQGDDPDCPAPDEPPVEPGIGGFRDFSLSGTPPEFRNLSFGIREVCRVAAEASNGNVTAILIASGTANDGSAPVEELPCDVPVLIHTVAPPWSSCTSGGNFGTLQEVSRFTGGTCTELEERDGSLISVDELTAVLPPLAPERTMLESITLGADGGHPTAVEAVEPALPALGPADVSWHQALELEPGTPEVCVTATRTAGIGGERAVDCVGLRVRGIRADPDASTIDLAQEDRQTVTATVVSESGLPVAFEVIDGPNAGVGGSAETDADGTASFGWENPNRNPDGLGMDVLEACFTDDLGNIECARGEHEWADLTPPTAACTVTHPGPHEPPEEGEGGPVFLALRASDLIDPDPQIFVRDTGSGSVFGPFADGSEVRYVQTAGAQPAHRPPDDQDDAPALGTITGNGGAEVFAVDLSGNTSEAVSCH
jgi:hypothetical protein